MHDTRGPTGVKGKSRDNGSQSFVHLAWATVCDVTSQAPVQPERDDSRAACLRWGVSGRWRAAKRKRDSKLHSYTACAGSIPVGAYSPRRRDVVTR
jgi:hypothetical protein